MELKEIKKMNIVDVPWEDGMQELCRKLVVDGLKVYALGPVSKHQFITVENANGGLASVQYDHIDGMSCSSPHVPCRSHGSAFGFRGCAVTVGLVKDICNGLRPVWARKMHVVHYKRFDEKRKVYNLDWVQLV